MVNLLKAEFSKLKNEKLFYYSILIIIGFSLLMSLGYMGLEIVIENEPIGDIFGFNGKSIFLGSFSPTQNVGILIPIILSIIITREFSYGTIRNKIICGHQKFLVYLSITISNLIMGLIFFLTNLVFNLLFGSLIIGYGFDFTSTEFLFILKSIGLGLLIYSSLIIFTIFVAMTIRSLGFSLMIVIFLLVFLGGLSVLDQIPGAPEILKNFVKILPHYYLINIGSLNSKLIIQATILTIIYLCLFSVLGIFIFKKSDIK